MSTLARDQTIQHAVGQNLSSIDNSVEIVPFDNEIGIQLIDDEELLGDVRLDAESDARRAWESKWNTCNPRWDLVANLPAKDYEHARIEFDFDILSLSALTSVFSGRTTAYALFNSPWKLKDWTQTKQESYLDFVPASYSTHPLVRAAVNCTMAQGRARLSSTDAEAKEVDAKILSLYGKALHMLQAALDDPVERFEAETLFATQMLQLFELLNYSQPQRVSYHIKGTIKLIEARGPTGYNTAFEKSLLMSQISSICRESFLENEECFLEKPEWRRLWARSIPPSHSAEHHPLVLSLFHAETSFPRLMRDVTNHITSPRHQFSSSMVSKLLAKLYCVLGLFQAWELDLPRLAEDLRPVQPVENVSNLRNVGRGTLIALYRFIIALDPLQPNAWAYENLVQQYSDEVVLLQSQKAEIQDRRAELLMASPVIIARVAISTKEEWQGAVLGLNDFTEVVEGMISRDIFVRWITMMGANSIPP